ncbi:MAG: ABC transporter ATP-binding protein [Hyphomicrobiales bacterium]
MTPANDLLRIENLRITFTLQAGTLEAVRKASMRILPGKVTALVGESGSGKSVIGQATLGILPRVGKVTGGKILFSDPQTPGQTTDIAALNPDGAEMRKLRGGRIAMIFQEPMTSLSPVHTIGNQIQEALQLHHPTSKKEAREKTEEMLGLVGFPRPSKAYDMYPFELSGGLRQRAMIAMALICRPALLIADEPTTALDVTIQAQILKLLKDLQERFEMAMLLITHDLGVVANAADEVAVLYHGEIMEAGTIRDIYRAPQHPYLKALMRAVPHFDMKPGERLVSLRDIPVNTQSLIGDDRQGRDIRRKGEPLIEVKGLSKSYTTRKTGWFGAGDATTVKAVDDVSFDIRRGECLGLVGESGCGKTTVSKILMRAVTADAGSAMFHANSGKVDLLKLSGAKLMDMRTKIQMIFQDPFSSLSPRMTVANILREPLEIHGIGSDESRRETVGELLRAVGLDPRFQGRYPHSFSGGQRQRIGIARAIALNPDLLICDEPVSALDVSVQAQVLNLLKDLQSELGLTYLFISHNLAVVDYMADRIAVMARGRIVELAPREQLFKNPVHPYTKALLAAVPYPDLARPLDFNLLNLAGASDDSAWGPQFRRQDGGADLSHIDVGDGHYVLANRNANVRELQP